MCDFGKVLYSGSSVSKFVNCLLKISSETGAYVIAGVCSLTGVTNLGGQLLFECHRNVNNLRGC